MRSSGAALATVSVAFLLVGLAWPGLAVRLLQGLLVTLAFAYVGVRVYRAELPKAMTGDEYSPFDGVRESRPPSASPAAIRGLTAQLRAVEDAEASRRVPIPSAAHRILADEVFRRLSEHHGLSFRDPADHARIRALVSDPTWALVRSGSTGERALALRDPVSLIHLTKILDDVERL